MAGAFIVLRSGSPQFEGMSWESHERLRIGRLESLEVTLNEPSISRLHAEVNVTPEGWVARDMGSSNGTFLNGVRLGRTDQRLRKHDVLKCGNVTLTVEVLQDKGPEVIKTAGSYMTVRAAAERSWDQAFDELVGPDGHGAPQNKLLVTLLRAGYRFGHSESLDAVLQSVLEDALSFFQAQRAGIFLVDEATGLLHPQALAAARGEDPVERTRSRALAQRSFRQGQSLLYQDVQEEGDGGRAGVGPERHKGSIICALLRSPRKLLGELYLERGGEQFTQEDLVLADSVAATLSLGIENAQLVDSQRDLFLHTITALAQAVELRDEYTGSHTNRVTTYALMLADELRVSAADRKLLQVATPLHDIGKIAVDDIVLRKPTRLTDKEFEHMKTHVLKGAAIVEMIPGLASMIAIIRNHHERWDGTGYPDRLAGEAIPRLARVVAVADAFDAMTSDRPYRAAMPLPAAFDELRDKAGTHFDPECVTAFLRLQHRIARLFSQEEAFRQMSNSAEHTIPREELLHLARAETPPPDARIFHPPAGKTHGAGS